MKSAQLRQKYLQYFQKKGHKIIPSASLVPSEEIDLAPTQRVMFTTAGMHPLVPYLLGKVHPEGTRLTSVQRCLRTDDIEEVGDSVHNTFFEMLGNWSLGDPASPDGIGEGGYWKKDAIQWSFEFLVNELKLDAGRIYISVFAGDNDAPFDKESYEIWRRLGVNEKRIFKYGKSENWWGPVGATGPCGPDTEMFYDLDPKPGLIDPANDKNRFMEIWNDVFMEYDKQKDGKYKPLKQKNVDTGMGLERILTVLQNTHSIYETDVFLPLLKKIEDFSTNFSEKSARIVADHLRSSVFLIADGVSSSNVGRGYILRRLIRRLIRHAAILEIKQDFLENLAKSVIKIYDGFYPKLDEFQKTIIKELQNEEEKFKKALALGLREFEKKQKSERFISGPTIFNLYQNYGFPAELTVELAKERNKKADLDSFEKLSREHQEKSRKASKSAKGGLTVKSETAEKLHTATHLLHQALRDVLGKHVHQTGSHITEERLRFDFSHSEKMTQDQIKKVQDLVNKKIKENLKVNKKTMPKKAADELGAIGLFDEKYTDMVKIYYIGTTDKIKDSYSKEFCGGPHTNTTGEIQNFVIKKEESAGAGVRRIYATIDIVV